MLVSGVMMQYLVEEIVHDLRSLVEGVFESHSSARERTFVSARERWKDPP
ncbi:unnamed protein product [Brassica oleracea var. botrytis]